VTERTRIPLHRDPKVRAIVFQLAALFFVVYGIYSLFETTVENLVSRGIQTGTGFLMRLLHFRLDSVHFLILI